MCGYAVYVVTQSGTALSIPRDLAGSVQEGAIGTPKWRIYLTIRRQRLIVGRLSAFVSATLLRHIIHEISSSVSTVRVTSLITVIR